MKKTKFTVPLLLTAMLLSFILLDNVCLAADAVKTERKDGEYTIQVVMEGGSGRASIVSPAALYIEDGYAYVRIEWSSSSYDYMLVEGEKYLPAEGEENSVFKIPVTAFDEPVTVVADTMAMSVPHEVEYQLTFVQDSISSAKIFPTWQIVIGIAAAFVVITGGIILYRKRR